MSRKFYIKTLGCKVNKVEEQVIIENLLELGLLQTKAVKEADLYILNSCSVTSASDSQSSYLINKARREKNDIKIILTGCVAQTIKLHSDFDTSNIDLILGNSEKLEIKKYIDDLFKDSIEKEQVKDIFEIDSFENKHITTTNQTRVNIKIQDGCNNRCSYCIIPYARGKSRSNTIENILKQIEQLASLGVKEVVLSGIHIGQFGEDTNTSLIELLKEIEKSPISRYRLGSLYVNEIDDKLLEFLKTSKKFCPHFHLSLQSMCNKTLENMNRKYSVEFALETIEKIHKSFNLPYIGCDIIVGFPEESDEDFKITYDNLEKSKVTNMHVFPYSKRENTPAARNINQVQNNVKTHRAKLLSDLSDKKHAEFLKENKNTDQEILFEKKSKKTGLYSAITRNFIKVYVKEDSDDLRNTLRVVNLADFEELY